MGQGCLGTSGAVETRGHQSGLHSTVRGEKEKLVSDCAAVRDTMDRFVTSFA
jgi:hypothetical protein